MSRWVWVPALVCGVAAAGVVGLVAWGFGSIRSCETCTGTTPEGWAVLAGITVVSGLIAAAAGALLGVILRWLIGR